jgi:hypothetical protein
LLKVSSVSKRVWGRVILPLLHWEVGNAFEE